LPKTNGRRRDGESTAARSPMSGSPGLLLAEAERMAAEAAARTKQGKTAAVRAPEPVIRLFEHAGRVVPRPQDWSPSERDRPSA
jgi:hypothetical protein